MGQPDIQQTFSPVSVEGFEQIYQPELTQAQGAPDQVQADPIIEAQGGPALTGPIQPQEIQPNPELQRLLSIIENQAHQLKAAGDVIMYLRSQVDDKDTQLKLLTDSQQKTGWLGRFSNWFLGRKA